ncbi:MAG: NAD(P)/FAD-dependent oxidoreductase [Magnetovibrionaceae bacterium]
MTTAIPSDTLFETDVAIIGAGPVGLFAVFECGMQKLSCHVIDALEAIGGQCSALYPEKPIFDIPAQVSVTGQGLVDKLAAQAEPFHPTYHLDQQVVSLEEAGEGFILATSKGTRIKARAVIIAAGVGAFGPNKPPLEGLSAFEGTSVQYMVTKREMYRGKRVVIGGGGDSAVDWAISLSDITEKLYLVHRRPKFRAAPESVARLNKLAEAGQIELVVPGQLAGLEGDDGQLSAVMVKDFDGNEQKIEADYLLAFYGLSQNLGPIKEWSLDLERNFIQVEPSTLETNRKGIFAIGDVAVYPGKLKLILCGFSEAAMAAHAIQPLVHPDDPLNFEYSTSKGVPGT